MRRVLGCLAVLVVATCFGIAAPAGIAVAADAVAASAPAIGPVPAHSELRTVTPASGATLTAPPAQVVLVFSEDVNPSFVTVALTNEGAPVALGAPAVTGPTVTAAVPPGAGAGAYRIAYRVVSQDGHPVSGASEFTVATATTPPPAAPAPAATTETSGPASATVAVTPVAAEPASTSSSATTVLGVVGAVLLVAAGGAVLAWKRRRDSA